MYFQLCLVQIVRIFHTKNQKIKKKYEGLGQNRLKLHTFREFFMILYDMLPRPESFLTAAAQIAKKHDIILVVIVDIQTMGEKKEICERFSKGEIKGNGRQHHFYG